MAFSGTKTNCVVDTAYDPDALIMDSSTDFDDASGDFDDADLLFDSGGASGTVVSTASYAFATVADLGAKFTSRVTPSMSQSVDDRVNLFDDAAESAFDSRAGNFDGNAASGCSSILSFAYSDDNVTYTDFQSLLAGTDVSARYIKFKLDMTSDGDVSPVITALSVSIDMPDKIQSERNKSIGSGGTTITFPSAFYAIPDVGVTVHSSATGDYFVLSSISATAFTINIYNSSAAGKTGTIDYMARKY